MGIVHDSQLKRLPLDIQIHHRWANAKGKLCLCTPTLETAADEGLEDRARAVVHATYWHCSSSPQFCLPPIPDSLCTFHVRCGLRVHAVSSRHDISLYPSQNLTSTPPSRRRLPHVAVSTLAWPRQIDSHRLSLPHNPRSNHENAHKQHNASDTADHNPCNFFRQQCYSTGNLESVRAPDRPPDRRVQDKVVVEPRQELTALKVDAVRAAGVVSSKGQYLTVGTTRLGDLPRPSSHIGNCPYHGVISLGRCPQVWNVMFVLPGLIFQFPEAELFYFLVWE